MVIVVLLIIVDYRNLHSSVVSGYTELRMEQMKVLDSLECLRLNNNNIEK